jgi:hypothetical protein
MNRKNKFIQIRFLRRIKLIKKGLFFFNVFSLFLFLISLSIYDTHSYFNAKVISKMNIQNAVKSELVEITTEELNYPSRCVAIQPVKIKNIFDYDVLINIETNHYRLTPGQEITHNQMVANNCGDFGEQSFQIIGYQNYFEHLIQVTVDKDLLNPCPQPAIDNANGVPNDNGQGRHCGNQRDSQTNNQEKIEPEIVEEIEENQDTSNVTDESNETLSNEQSVENIQNNDSASETIVNNDTESDHIVEESPVIKKDEPIQEQIEGEQETLE